MTHQGIIKYGNEEGTQKLSEGPEHCAHAIANRKSDVEAMEFALHDEPKSAKDGPKGI